MKLNTKELQRYRANSRYVEGRLILPICGYIKVDAGGTLTKNNTHAFYQESLTVEDGFDVLIDEKQLFAFLNSTSADEVEIRPSSSGYVSISDGYTTMRIPTMEFKHFPKIPDQPEEYTKLPRETLLRLQYASKVVDAPDRDVPMVQNFISFWPGGIIGMNIACGSFYPHDEIDYPSVCLSKETCECISDYQEIDFAQSDSWHLFKSDFSYFGFLKPAVNFVDMSRYFQSHSSQNTFKIDKSEWLSFNTLAMGTGAFSSKMYVMDGELHLEAGRDDTEIRKSIPVIGFEQDVTQYAPNAMNRLLKSLPDETITFSRGKGFYYLTGDEGFTALIMDVVDNPVVTAKK